MSLTLAPLFNRNMNQAVMDRVRHRSLGASMSLTVWLFLAMVLCMAYSCNLLVILTTRTYTKPIETAEDVLDSGLPMFMMPILGTVQTFFINSPFEVMRKVYEVGQAVSFRHLLS